MADGNAVQAAFGILIDAYNALLSVAQAAVDTEALGTILNVFGQ